MVLTTIRINQDIWDNIIRIEASECRMAISTYLSYVIEFSISSPELRKILRNTINAPHDKDDWVLLKHAIKKS